MQGDTALNMATIATPAVDKPVQGKHKIAVGPVPVITLKLEHPAHSCANIPDMHVTTDCMLIWCD